MVEPSERPAGRRSAYPTIASAAMTVPPTPLPYESTFDALYGLEIVERDGDVVRARVAGP